MNRITGISLLLAILRIESASVKPPAQQSKSPAPVAKANAPTSMTPSRIPSAVPSAIKSSTPTEMPVDSPSTNGIFKIYSPTVTTSLSNEYNCNSNTTGVNPPFNWVNPPAGTVGFALLMGSYQLSADGTWVASGFDWGIYNLASNVTSVAQNCSNPFHTTCGRAGAAWNNGHPNEAKNYYYWPPCSSDCLIKNYTFTVYALASQITNPAYSLSNYNLSLLVLEPGVTLASSSMMVWSLRTKGCDEPSFEPTQSPAGWSSFAPTGVHIHVSYPHIK